MAVSDLSSKAARPRYVGEGRMTASQLLHRTQPLSEKEKKHIRARYASGVSLKVLTKTYRVGREVIVKAIGKLDTRRHVQ